MEGGAGLKGERLKGNRVEVEGALGVEVEVDTLEREGVKRDGVMVGKPYVYFSLSSW